MPPSPRAALARLIALRAALCAALCAAICAHLCPPAAAQVNIESSRVEGRPGLHLATDATLSLVRGNMTLTQLGGTLKAQYTRGAHTPFVQASVAYGERDGEPFLDQSFWHARWTAMWRPRVGSELFAQLQRDSFRSLALRQLYGVGARALLAGAAAPGAPPAPFTLAVGLGYMLERETYAVAERAGAPEEVELNHRASSYLSARALLRAAAEGAPEVMVTETLYLQPLVTRPGDLRALSDLSVEVKLSDALRLVESLSALYDSAPPPGVSRFDLRSLTSLRVAL